MTCFISVNKSLIHAAALAFEQKMRMIIRVARARSGGKAGFKTIKSRELFKLFMAPDPKCVRG